MKSSRGRIDAIQLGGAIRGVTGYASYEGQADELPIAVHGSGSLDITTATADQAGLYFPFAAKIISASIYYPTAPTAAAATVDVGTLADADKFLNHTAALDLEDGDREDDVELITGDIEAGETVVFGSDGAATAGEAYVTLVIAPRLA